MDEGMIEMTSECIYMLLKDKQMANYMYFCGEIIREKYISYNLVKTGW